MINEGESTGAKIIPSLVSLTTSLLFEEEFIKTVDRRSVSRV